MNRQELVARFVAFAAIVEESSREVAQAIRGAINNREIPYTWIVRWNYSGHEWDNVPSTAERIIGRALVIGACGEWQKKLPFIIPENGRYQKIWVNQVDPLNKSDLEDAKRARELGMHVRVQPKYQQPKPGTITIQEEFEEVVKTARATWLDNSIRGYVVTGHEPGWDDDGRPIDVPVFGDQLEYGPGFQVSEVPEEWVGTYSKLTAYSQDGSMRFEACFSNGGGGSVDINEVPSDAEWRIPRHLVEELLVLMEEASILRKKEEEEINQTRNDNERKRLAAKFNV